MGGGDVLPSAATIQGLMNEASTAEIEGNLKVAASKYRESSEILLRLAKSRGISRDEVFSLELQGSELLDRARQIEEEFPKTNNLSPPVSRPTATPTPPGTNFSVPPGPIDSVYAPKTSERVGAAAVGAAAGFTVGGIIGMPIIGMFAGGAAGGMSACRDDEYGEKARDIGRYGAHAIDEAKNLEKKYNISGNAIVAMQSAVYKTVELNKKYDISGKAATAAKSAVEKAGEINRKYNVADNVAKTISTGLDKLNSVLKPENNS